MLYRVTAIVLGTLLTAAAAAATAHRHHGPHVHGKATLNIGLDGQLFVASLSAPGMSLLGFEHPPRSDDERASYARAVDALRHPEQWLELPATGACVLESADVQPHGFGDPDEKKDGNEDGHADFDAAYRYRCNVPLAVRQFDVKLIERFPALHKVDVAIVIADREGSQTLTAGSSTVVLTQ